MSSVAPVPSTADMWRAYAIAPAVTPITFIAIVSMIGVALPANIIAMGFLACYLVAGLVGMPIAFSLRSTDSLNAWTIHCASLAWAVLWSLFCTVTVVYVVTAIGGSIQSLLLTAGCFLAVMVPPVVLAGTVFWLLLNRPKRI